MKSAEASNTAADVMLMRLSFRDKPNQFIVISWILSIFLANFVKKKIIFPPKSSRIPSWPREKGNKP